MERPKRHINKEVFIRIVKELLEAGLLNGDTLTCTGETLQQQIARLDPPEPDSDVIFPIKNPFKNTGGLRVLGGNLSPDFIFA